MATDWRAEQAADAGPPSYPTIQAGLRPLNQHWNMSCCRVETVQTLGHMAELGSCLAEIGGTLKRVEQGLHCLKDKEELLLPP